MGTVKNHYRKGIERELREVISDLQYNHGMKRYDIMSHAARNMRGVPYNCPIKDLTDEQVVQTIEILKKLLADQQSKKQEAPRKFIYNIQDKHTSDIVLSFISDKKVDREEIDKTLEEIMIQDEWNWSDVADALTDKFDFKEAEPISIYY